MLANNISIPAFLRCVDQTTSENRRIPFTSPNPVITRATHVDIGTSPRTTHLSTPEPSASTPPKLEASTPQVAIIAENTAVSLTPGSLDVPSAPSPAPVFDDMFPTVALLSLDASVTGASSLIERPSCQRSSSALDMGAAADT